jgi:hypothetical protein
MSRHSQTAILGDVVRAGNIWPFAVLLVVGILRLVWLNADERRAFAFEVQAGGPVPQWMQIYFQRDPDPGLSEKASFTNELRSVDLHVYRFRLGDGVYRALRFDPMRGSGTARFSRAQIVDTQSGRVVCALPVSSWKVGQNIQRAAMNGDTLEVEVAPGQDDPTFNIPLPSDALVLQHSYTGRVLATVIVILAAVGLTIGAQRITRVTWVARLLDATIMRPLSAVEQWLRRMIPREILPLDRLAIGFLGALLFVVAVGIALELHGSSSSIRSHRGVPIGDWEPLYGTPKNIRNDEWNVQTPLFLYQLNRPDPLAVDSIVGPGKSILIANAPVRHWSTLFRPQFFPFFVLSTTRAYAAYWQGKNLLLVAGTFLLFLLLTRSSRLAVFGASWFWLSSYTQWAFSWPAELPEMIGLLCLSVVSACLIFVVPSGRVAGVLGLGLLLTAVDFVLCSYPPFQVPLAWAGFGIWCAWMLQPRAGPQPDATGPVKWRQGFVTLGMTVFAVAAVVALFLREIAPVIEITAHTSYPGNRSLPGGGITWQQLLSAFAGPLMDETHCPPGFMNICEGSGYFWLGPISLALAIPVFRARPKVVARTMYFVLFAPLFLLVTWAVVAVPANVGRLFLLDKVQSSRVLPALGLINISITLVFLSLVHQVRPAIAATSGLRRRWFLPGATAFIYFALFWAMNRKIGNFFAPSHLAIIALLLGVATLALAQGWTRILATLVLAPLMWTNLLINPVDRGLDVYERSALRKFVDAHPCKDGRWLVASRNATAAQYFAALGLDVFNVMHYVPFIDRWRRFDPDGHLDAYYNGSGSSVARVLPPGSEFRLEPVSGAVLGPPLFKRLCVDPADTRLREIGIRYFALEGPSNPTLFPENQFEQLTELPVDGYTLYRIRDR